MLPVGRLFVLFAGFWCLDAVDDVPPTCVLCMALGVGLRVTGRPGLTQSCPGSRGPRGSQPGALGLWSAVPQCGTGCPQQCPWVTLTAGPFEMGAREPGPAQHRPPAQVPLLSVLKPLFQLPGPSSSIRAPLLVAWAPHGQSYMKYPKKTLEVEEGGEPPALELLVLRELACCPLDLMAACGGVVLWVRWYHDLTQEAGP